MRLLRKIFKWTSFIVMGLVVSIGFSYLYIHMDTEKRLSRTYEIDLPPITIPDDSASIARGEHLFTIFGCIECHGGDLGGRFVVDDPMVARVFAPNLTKGPGGLPADFGVDDYWRALKLGVNSEGKPLLIMPSHEITHYSDEDLAAIIAYCMQHEPVASQERIREIGPVGRILMATDHATIASCEKIDPKHRAPATVERSVTRQYGQYLSMTCQGCHRPDLRGGPPLAPGFPPVPDITAHGNAGKWSTVEFKRTLRTGITPDGTILKEGMPWKYYGQMTDEELEALHLYLKSLGGTAWSTEVSEVREVLPGVSTSLPLGNILSIGNKRAGL